jgi:hypothetical protein
MNPRHAAALALVGWYPITPPASDWERWQKTFAVTPGFYAHRAPFDSAPYWRWKNLGEFDSQVNRESARQLLVRRDGTSTDHRVLSARLYEARSATCIASDDPRLKEK